MKIIHLMKNLAAAVVVVFLSFSCSGSDEDGTNNGGEPINVQELTTISTSGTWRITSYLEEGENETHHFTNFNFTFNPDGTVTAVNGDTTINGTWAISDDDDSDDDSPSDSDEDFVLNFNVDDDSDFDDLNDDWDIESYTANRISLVDISGGDGGTDILVFEKN